MQELLLALSSSAELERSRGAYGLFKRADRLRPEERAPVAIALSSFLDREKDPEMRAHAAHVLVELDDPSRDNILLKHFAADPPLMSRIRHPRLPDFLLGRLEHGRTADQINAETALGALSHPSAALTQRITAEMRRLARSHLYARVRAAAVRVIRLRGDHLAAPLLLARAYEDADHEVRSEAREALFDWLDQGVDVAAFAKPQANAYPNLTGHLRRLFAEHNQRTRRFPPGQRP